MTTQEGFIDRLLHWFTHDVKVCMDNDAFIGAMTLMLCHISALASYYAGRTNRRPSNDELEFLAFYEKYFTVFPNIQKPQQLENGTIKQVSVIYNHFRCGLVHEGLMKQGAAIDRGENTPVFYINQPTGDIVLNVDSFYVDYCNVIEKYRNGVKSDHELRENFKKRALFLGAEDPIF